MELSQPTGSRTIRRAVVATVGASLLIAGVAMLVLPGPGVVTILAGLTVLATEFHWARRVKRKLVVYIRRRIRRKKLKEKISEGEVREISEERELTEDVPELAEIYSWPPGWWARAMMVQTIDGAFFGPDGKSRSISSDRDREVLVEARRLADVVLVGAQTIRTERYRPMVAKPEWQAARAAIGAQPAPVVAIVSASLDLPWEEPLFGESAITPMVFTDGSATRERTLIAEEIQSTGRVEIIECASLPLDALEVLRQRGFTRIVCEGGPRLLRDLFSEIDEIDLTIAPMLIGQDVPASDADLEPNRIDWILEYVWDHEGFIFNKYLRA
jgi:riboflavin biosynthesis pyrimidine reductase